MATLFTLPLLGQTMQEGTILKWLKQEGDTLEGWETLFEVMTDKINMEVEPQVSGVLRKILAPEGATLPVGAPVAIIGTADESIDAMLAGLATNDERPTTNGGSASLLDGHASLVRNDATDAPPAISPRARHRAEEAGVEWRALSLPGTGYEGMIVERDIEAYLRQAPAPSRVTPLAGKLATELGLDVTLLAGTGPGGKVTVDDVRTAALGARRSALGEGSGRA